MFKNSVGVGQMFCPRWSQMGRMDGQTDEISGQTDGWPDGNLVRRTDGNKQGRRWLFVSFTTTIVHVLILILGMSLPKFLYNNVWRKSNVAYLTYIAVGVIVLGGAYEKVTESFWRSHNKGVSRTACAAIWGP
jgi:hypothetical protein